MSDTILLNSSFPRIFFEIPILLKMETTLQRFRISVTWKREDWLGRPSWLLMTTFWSNLWNFFKVIFDIEKFSNGDNSIHNYICLMYKAPFNLVETIRQGFDFLLLQLFQYATDETNPELIPDFLRLRHRWTFLSSWVGSNRLPERRQSWLWTWLRRRQKCPLKRKMLFSSNNQIKYIKSGILYFKCSFSRFRLEFKICCSYQILIRDAFKKVVVRFFWPCPR